jgi:hypothetical protein
MATNNPEAIRVQFDALRSLAYTGVSSSYAAVGTAFTRPARIVKITNTMDADATISFGGGIDNDYVPAGGFVLYDYCANMATQGGYMVQAIGTVVSAKTSGSPSKGAVYVTVIEAV